MPKLKTIYDTQEDVPDGFNELYVERGGKWELTGIEGVKTQADIDRVQEGLRKEKADHKATKDKLAKYGDIDPEKVPAQLAELEEAKTRLDAFTKDGKIDETKIQPVIEAAVKRALGPVEREKGQLQRDLDAARKTTVEKEAEVVSLRGAATQRSIELSLRDAALAGKVIPTAVDDAVMVGSRYFETTEDGRVLTKDGAGITAGLNPTEWLKDMQEKRPHWWPVSVGGNARGGSGGTGDKAGNPWTAEGWSITKQGAYVTQHGIEKAAQAAAAANSRVGATRPTPKAA